MAADDSDIDRWIDQLAGRRRADAPREEFDEVERLRRAIERHALNEASVEPDSGRGVDLDEKQAWQAMRFRLRGARGTSPPRRRTFAVSLALVATLLLAIGVAVLLRTPSDDGIAIAFEAPPRYHGDVPAVEVKADDPLDRAKRLARSLAPHGVEPRVYFHDGRATVEFSLQPAHRAAVERELAAASISVESLRIGVDRVVFIPR